MTFVPALLSAAAAIAPATQPLGSPGPGPAEAADLHPLWIIAIILTAAAAGCMVLRMLCCIGADDPPHPFLPQIKITWRPKYCPHCGKRIKGRGEIKP